jgi:repressor LexA
MKEFGKLHPTQERLLRAMAELEGLPLSLRKLGKRIGIDSPNTIAHHLKQLELKGYLVPEDDGNYRVVEEPIRDVVYLPLYGNAACGREEFFAKENVEEMIPLPARTLRITSDFFLVRAKGSSMEPKIHNNDLLLVQSAQTADSGHIVLAVLDEGIFAKKFVRDGKQVWLVSFNHQFNPVSIGSRQQFRILGHVRGVLRNTIR